MIRVSRLLTAAYTIRSLYMTASMALSYRCLRSEANQAEHASPGGEPGLTVIIPALREQAVIPRSLAHFADLAAQWPQLRVLVVTAAREAAETPSEQADHRGPVPGPRTSTQRASDQEVFHVVSYPGQGRRASQLNYAVAALEELLPPSDDYIAVFDADTVPDARLRSQFTQAAMDRPAMIQQPMLPAFPQAAGGARQ